MPQADDPLWRLTVDRSQIAKALTKIERHPVSYEDIRAAGCVGIELSDMLCSWKRRGGTIWRTSSCYVDLTGGKLTLLTDVEKNKPCGLRRGREVSSSDG